MNVEGSCKQVGIVQTDGLSVWACEQMTFSHVFFIEPHRIAGEKVPHRFLQLVFTGACKQVNMGRHKAKGIDIKVALSGDIFQLG